MNRRRLLLGAVATAALGGCGTDPSQGDAWHRGQITVGTGPTNDVFNQIGGGYADVITRHLPGYEAVAVPTNGAAENLQRLVRGDVDVAFTFADSAADAVAGLGAFANNPQPIRALARVFSSYTHLVTRAAGPIKRLADLADRRVGMGPPRSGTEVVATRILTSAGIRVKQVSGSLNQMIALMRSGDLDAMFYSAGVPTVGITALFERNSTYTLLPTASVLADLQRTYPGIYTDGSIPGSVYGLIVREIPTVTIPNLIVVAVNLPERLAYEMTRLIFDYQGELELVHPEGKNISQAVASHTLPVQLHDGAQRYYSGLG
ncbi:TRAP transporter TAXI family solute receptor [Allocatelliglobosispora scoriae]|uniref:TRAP transporter TAXI family solute receptor n=1 Tax=Allocatelliglobosispora scoriae TaxID=643052 RepID=A0A841BYZ4_9ACTN|nr:TAXI family TRAP transporter solute-binding subunit [Allocatelliglobosispora scoriae]MBB5872895.1 TRAP transporter TAXI family solute receptor [Allocatelliglobosispora scoriae]